MFRRRHGMRRAVAGVALAGGALAAIGWWNTAALRGRHSNVVAATSAHSAAELAGNTSPHETLSAAELAAQSAGDHGPATTLPSTQPASPHAPLPGSLPGAAPGLSSGASTQPAASTGSAAVSGLLLHARQLEAAGKRLEARAGINAALVAGSLSSTDTESAKAYLRELNETLVFSPTLEPSDAWAEVVSLQSGETLTKISNATLIPHILLMRINHITDDRKLRKGQSIKTLKGPFHAVVDKRAFTLDLYLGAPGGPGSLYVTTYHVGLGASDSTPTGLWKCTQGNKLKNPTYHSPRGGGIISANDPKNPLGEYWIGLTGLEGEAVGKTSYGIHGTIEPDSIGKMSSMGCIRLVNPDVERVFEMLFEGKSTVRVVE